MKADGLQIPSSADIRAIQGERKKLAVERARRSAFWRGKLDGIRIDRLDDPAEWRKIPILDKEMLRALSPEAFYRDFCIARPDEIAEYWRSGGSTGRPLFYPRTFEDIRYAMIGFRRTYLAAGCGPGDRAHLSLPLGIHPAGQMWARAGEEHGIAMIWAGSGSAAPSELQLDLMAMLKPTLWMGMSSYGLHLAALADARGVRPGGGSVKRIMTTAEPLSEAKRAKLAAEWGAEVFDTFGMTEAMMMGAETRPGEGFRLWTDLNFVEVLDAETLEPVAPGAEGVLVVTPLFTNNATPFLRWNSGDIVRLDDQPGDHPLAVFPVLKHANRTSGFFKIRGVNINHAECEDFIFSMRELSDFKAELVTEGAREVLRLSIELRREAHDAAETLRQRLVAATKSKFEVTPEVVILPSGTLAKEFAQTVKAQRFADLRR